MFSKFLKITHRPCPISQIFLGILYLLQLTVNLLGTSYLAQYWDFLAFYYN